MSFFKKLVDKVEDMFDDDKDKAKQNEKPAENQIQATPPPHGMLSTSPTSHELFTSEFRHYEFLCAIYTDNHDLNV